MAEEIDITDEEIDAVRRHYKKRARIISIIESIGQTVGCLLECAIIFLAFVFAVWVALQVLGE